MRNVLLITLFDEVNIGNRLQNYALQKILNKYGAKVTTVDNYYTNVFSAKSEIKYIIKKLLTCIGCRKYQKDCRAYGKLHRMRKSIRKFNNKNLSTVKKITNQQAFNADWSDYDLAIAGSDQVWHKWRSDENELPFYYLEFMPSNKRASYAASFGFESFPKQDIEQHRNGLTGMKYISCRENRGCSLVQELIGREVLQVLDPTLLLSANEWREIKEQASSFSKEQTNFAFIFFLGDISDEYQAHINSVKKNFGIEKLIYFDDLKALGPCDFLYLIDQSEYVFTDSFHCTVFSTLFNKRFTVFKRVQPEFEKMFGRIEDLLASTNKLDFIYGGSSREPENNFDELYNTSIRYIEEILGATNES